MTFLASIRDGLAEHARRQAMAYVLAFLLATSASLGAFIETFGPLTRAQVGALAWWQVCALLAKCLAPGVAAIIALLVKSPLQPTTPARP
jgi:predicted PurR-regulated permease PerM